MSELARRAGAVTEDILRLMGIEATVRADDSDEDDGVCVTVEAGEHDEVVIGRKGETLEALQQIVSRIINRGSADDRAPVTIDVSGYLEQRSEQLVTLAHQLAERVRRTGREEVTEALSAPERRTIHRALTGEEGLTTYSLGEGLKKRLVVAPVGAPRLEESDVEEEPSSQRGAYRRGGGGYQRERGRERGPGRGAPPHEAGPGRGAPRGEGVGRGDRGGSPSGMGPSSGPPGRREGRGDFARRGGGGSFERRGPETPPPPSDGRIRDLIRAGGGAAAGAGAGAAGEAEAKPRKTSFRIVHMPPGYSPPPQEKAGRPESTPDEKDSDNLSG